MMEDSASVEETTDNTGKSSWQKKNVAVAVAAATHNNHHRYKYLSNYGGGGSSGRRRFLFFASCFGLYAIVAATYAWLTFPPHIGRTDHVSTSSLGCREDNEGSWSIGVFYGDSPFSLKPIESVSFPIIIYLGLMNLNHNWEFTALFLVMETDQ